jgi:hypothetical protein
MRRRVLGKNSGESILKLCVHVRAYDAYFVQLKTWGGTGTSVTLLAAFAVDATKNADARAALLLLGLTLATSSWITEAMLRKAQALFSWRHWDLEAQLSRRKSVGEESDRFAAERAPAAAYTYWKRSNERNLWRFIAHPVVMLPHIFFAIFAFAALVATDNITIALWSALAFVIVISWFGSVRLSCETSSVLSLPISSFMRTTRRRPSVPAA